MNTMVIPSTASPLDRHCWLGLDVSKERFDAAVWTAPALGEVRSWRTVPTHLFPRTAAGAAACLAWARQREPRLFGAVMEATGDYSIELARWLEAADPAMRPAIINPRLAKAFAESLSISNRNDKADARALARYGVDRQPAPFAPPKPDLAKLRDLVRYRQALVEERTSEENRAEAGAAAVAVRRMQKRRIAQLDRDVLHIEKDARALLKAAPELQRDVNHLVGIYGVGWVTAVTVLAEFGDLRRFTRARQLTAFAGLAPKSHDSGTSVHKKPHVSKNGSAHVRRVLYLSALAAIRGANDFSEMYRRLTDAGKKPIVAIVAVMRKLLVVMRAILISGQSYDPSHRHHPSTTCG